ncbi:MAG: DUF308 domain-containing protein [Mesorhizobium sp.]|uniref:DUF308 domain-containing protein n=1 Tax=Mesorhizobium sp. TaxID=1871066 RepID=UPI001AC57495|nr:DUF308 domain-containing protein [Mesorhizobium sp.]MBN9219225.1 DUF308 domain-containing protein [Mesorhizobium sp.]
MPEHINDQSRVASSNEWLRNYYYLRFAVSAAWVVAAFTVAKSSVPVAAAMLIAYPAWDALANYVDARRTGGLGRNRSQLLNFAISILAAIAVAIALGHGMNAVLSVFGVWAVVAGVFQLLTAVRRWKTSGAQWAMILSGAQSALAGLFFVRMAGGTQVVGIVDVAPYAAFGAFYFLVSALWLSIGDAFRKSRPAASQANSGKM